MNSKAVYYERQVNQIFEVERHAQGAYELTWAVSKFMKVDR